MHQFQFWDAKKQITNNFTAEITAKVFILILMKCNLNFQTKQTLRLQQKMQPIKSAFFC